MGFEQDLQNKVFSDTGERTFIDKLLAKEEVKDIRELIKKPRLTRSELLEILYLISGTESKLVNYGTYDRYVILKFFVWIREFIKIAELLFDYTDELYRKENTCTLCLKYINTNKEAEKCVCEVSKPYVVLTERSKRLLDNNQRLIEHNAKFLIDLYLNIARTSLSIGATGMLELLKNRYEVQYMPTPPSPPVQQQTGFLVKK